jgi:hypothetical protein
VWIFRVKSLVDPMAQDRLMMEAQTSGVRRHVEVEVTDHVATENQVPQGVQGPFARQRQGRHRLNFGSYGLKALEPERVTARQIEAARRAKRHLRRQGRLWIRVFPDLPSRRSLLKSVRVRARVRSNIGLLA